MRKALIPFLVLGLLLLGVSPAMAAGEQVKAALPAQQDEVVQVVVPEGEELSTDELEKTIGEFDFFMFSSGVFNAVNGFRTASRAAAVNDVAGVFLGMAQFLFGVGQAAFGVVAPL